VAPIPPVTGIPAVSVVLARGVDVSSPPTEDVAVSVVSVPETAVSVVKGASVAPTEDVLVSSGKPPPLEEVGVALALAPPQAASSIMNIELAASTKVIFFILFFPFSIF
jgi:hypothetical protein